MVKAVAYLRVSGKGQVSGDGFTRQMTAIKKYAAAHDIRIVKVYREEGVSGTKDWEKRPAFAEMMAALLSDGVRTVIVEKLDRVARDLMVQESIIADFQRKELAIISVSEPDLCSDDPSRVLMRQVLGAFFQYEKTMIVLKLRGARQRVKAKEGVCEGAKPFGHYEDEDAVLKRMQELRSEGKGFDAIAAALNNEGFKPRRGVQWYGSAVNKILSRQAA